MNQAGKGRRSGTSGGLARVPLGFLPSPPQSKANLRLPERLFFFFFFFRPVYSGANRHITRASVRPFPSSSIRSCSSALGARFVVFSLPTMGSSNQEPGMSLRTDGWLQKPVDSLMQIPDKIQNSLKLHFGRFLKTGDGGGVKAQMSSEKVRGSCSAAAVASEVNLERQLQAWKNDPTWTDQPPDIKVTVPQGSLCNLNLSFKAGLPPDAVYNIIIDPENKRVFKNIKEVISRKVLLDEGSRQVVEVEQAAIWKFLWWSGILSVHVFVDQNRRNHTVRFKQGRSGFMKKFEGCWKIEPLFADKEECLPLDPCTLEEYDSCTAGRGRVGSAITLDQLIEPAILPPQPIAWYVRGITTRTTEMLVNDLIAETARLRSLASNVDDKHCTEDNCEVSNDLLTKKSGDVKERWRQRRKCGRHGSSLRSTRQV